MTDAPSIPHAVPVNGPRRLGGSSPPRADATAVTTPESPFDDNRGLLDKCTYSACYAPHTSLFFDQFGDVRACCHNIQGTLGNIRTQSIREIWDGAQAARLREALERRDLSLGCGHCQWQEDNGASDTRFSRVYDHRPLAEPRPTWPVQMEFALTNACNLQCEMCNGWKSSAIRAHRDKLPPLDMPYGEEFFEELAEFLVHLDHVTVLGGEPFLGRESLRVLEMVAALDRPPSVWVTTNGTQWTPRVRRLMERLPMSLDFSLDGATKETFESIRIGADFDSVMENLDHYADSARRSGERVGLSFCLMTNNCHEFVDLLLLAERRGLDFFQVNTVTFPLTNSFYRLDKYELTAAVAELERMSEKGARELSKFRGVWDEQIGALRNRVEKLNDDGPSGALGPRTAEWEGEDSETVRQCIATLNAWEPAREPTQLRSDEDMVFSEVIGPLLAQLGIVRTQLVGHPLLHMLAVIEQATGSNMAPVASRSDLGNEMSFTGSRDGKLVCEFRTFLFQNGANLIIFATLQENAPRG